MGNIYYQLKRHSLAFFFFFWFHPLSPVFDYLFEHFDMRVILCAKPCIETLHIPTGKSQTLCYHKILVASRSVQNLKLFAYRIDWNESVRSGAVLLKPNQIAMIRGTIMVIIDSYVLAGIILKRNMNRWLQRQLIDIAFSPNESVRWWLIDYAANYAIL